MIDHVDIGQAQNILGKPPQLQPSPPRANASGSSDASLRTQFAEIIDLARKLPEPDGLAVARARALLAAGKLDTPQNILQAATGIAEFGF